MNRPTSTRPLDSKRVRTEDPASKPPRALLCHCLKCDDKWTVRMQLVQDPEPVKTRGRGKNQKRMVWIFPPESFDHCEGCGAKNGKNLYDQKVIDSTLARTDSMGRVKLHIPGSLNPALPLEDDLVQEQE